MKLLYITYVDIGNYASGSSVRPQKIRQAFDESGIDYQMLSGDQWSKRKTRKAAIKETSKWLDCNDVDLCYVESPSGIIRNFADVLLLLKIHRRGIPISLFYRDAYWLLANEWLGKKDMAYYAKQLLSIRDILVYNKVVTRLYAPSQMMIDLLASRLHIQHAKPLPPGTDEHRDDSYRPSNTGIYVGSSAEHYGIDELVEAYARLFEMGRPYRLIVVTRENEFSRIADKCQPHIDAGWLEVLHVSGDDQLAECYERADVAFVPSRKHQYMDLAYSVKLFEYISYGKPVICNDLVEMGGFVARNQCGIVFKQSVESLCEAIDDFYQSGKQYSYHDNVVQTKANNTWRNRVMTIIEDSALDAG